MHLGSLFAFTYWLKCTFILVEMCILVQITSWMRCAFWNAHLGITFTFAFWLHNICNWRRCAFGGTHLHLHFSCNAHILEYVCAFGDHICICILVAMYTYFGRDAHFKYNCIYLFIEEMTLIKRYCNLYHISSMIEENKTNFAS